MIKKQKNKKKKSKKIKKTIKPYKENKTKRVVINENEFLTLKERLSNVIKMDRIKI